MPTIAEILAGIDSVVTPAKRRLSDMIRNPLASAQQTLGLLGDRAQEFDRDIGLGVDRRALQNAGSVMANAPQYVDADRRTVDRMNSLIGSFAPIGLTVYHGSPHKFDRFDSSKIGTGEGAQAYGHGIYVAESPEVAANYRNPGGPRTGTLMPTIDGVPADRMVSNKSVSGPEYLAASSLSRNRSVNHAIDYLQQDVSFDPAAQKAIEWIKQNKHRINDAPGASLYKADLPDDQIAKMLDWDKPLSQQAPEVQRAIKRTDEYKQLKKSAAMRVAEARNIDDWSGHFFINEANRMIGKERGAIENKLQAMGIPGIRYLDGGSRSAGQGSSNFVVFPGNEGLLKILERNGEPVK